MPSIDIFIGAPLEHASERATLARAVEVLSAESISAVILANMHLSGRQIDLVVGLERGALVIEAKASSAALQGTENGRWKVRLASGRWKNTPNAYDQTLKESLALRDAMTTFAGADVPYPRAALIYVPEIPLGSQLPSGDFKVSIAGLDQLAARITSVKGGGWELETWRVFATRNNLNKVSSVDAALSPKLFDAEQLLVDYENVFRDTYDAHAAAIIPLWYVRDTQTLSWADVLEETTADGNVLLTGDSGCGKTLLSYAIALAGFEHGRIPIVIPAKDFQGSLRDVANREATLLGAPSAIAVIRASQRLNKRLLLVIDGYNECNGSEQERLTRSIAAASKRYGASAVVSSTRAVQRNDLLPGRIYAVRTPDIETKRAIAQQAGEGASVGTYLELLESVGSCLEARMIGELGNQLPVGTSKFALFDAYVRKRLGQAASDGIRLLSCIAGKMMDRISFGLSLRELDRVLERERVSSDVLSTLEVVNILDKRGDRISFSHEMFLNVYAAESIIRRAGNDPDAVIAALQLPQHIEMRPLVPGGIDDERFQRLVLSGLSDVRVVRACLAGHCGAEARLWANKRCDEVLAQVAEEIETLRFEVSPFSQWNVAVRRGTSRNWTAQDGAVLAAISYEFLDGRRLDDVLKLIGKMDERLSDERHRLISEGARTRLGLRNSLFAECYTGFGGSRIGMTKICGPVYTGKLFDGQRISASANLAERLSHDQLSPGMVGLLIELDKYSDLLAHSVGAMLPQILSRIWPEAGYHLRLGLMDAAGRCTYSLSDGERVALIEAIQALIPPEGGIDSSGIIQALKSLGALDADRENHEASAKAEIDQALAEPGNPLMWEAAAGLWHAQFDHPYDVAYQKAWHDLASADRKTLLLMSAQSRLEFSIFVPSLIAELAFHAGAEAGPIIARWTALPWREDGVIPDAFSTFAIAYAALARLQCPAPDHWSEAQSHEDHTLLACGEIIYWLNREDYSRADRHSQCARPIEILLRHEWGVAASIIGRFLRSDYMFNNAAKDLPGTEPVVGSIGVAFPNEVGAIYRAALEQITNQTGYPEFFRIEDLIEQALVNLGRYGDERDLPLLRKWSSSAKHGASAVLAIKAVERAPGHTRPSHPRAN